MKKSSFVSFLALIALCSVAALRAESSSGSVAPTSTALIAKDELTVSSVPAKNHVNGDTVDHGTSRALVRARLGQPYAVLADGTWLYCGYSAHLSAKENASNSAPAAQDREFTRSGILVVRFVSNKVASLSLASEAAVASLRQATRTANEAPRMVATGTR